MWSIRAGAAIWLASCPARAASFAILTSVSGGPQIGAVQGTTLYGTVAYNGAGQLFSVSTSGTQYRLLHSFTAAADGQAPNARLAVNAGGIVFGTAPSGGAYGGGTAWMYTPKGRFYTTHSFGAGGDGSAPMQGPTLAGGRLYDATGEGAIGGSGNIFTLTPGGAYTVMYEFMSQGDGHCPFSGVAAGPGGVLYGTTVGVGFGGNPTGSVWRYSAAGGLTTLYVFTNGADGEWPHQAPSLDPAGNLFGTTAIRNGTGFDGAIWRISAAGRFALLHSMHGATDGSGPNSPLLFNSDGNFYGTASGGGQYGYGTVFSISPAGKFSVVHSFTGGADGAQPTGNLVRDAAGAVYGGTAYGPVFKIVP